MNIHATNGNVCLAMCCLLCRPSRCQRPPLHHRVERQVRLRLWSCGHDDRSLRAANLAQTRECHASSCQGQHGHLACAIVCCICISRGSTTAGCTRSWFMHSCSMRTVVWYLQCSHATAACPSMPPPLVSWCPEGKKGQWCYFHMAFRVSLSLISPPLAPKSSISGRQSQAGYLPAICWPPSNAQS